MTKLDCIRTLLCCILNMRTKELRTKVSLLTVFDINIIPGFIFEDIQYLCLPKLQLKSGSNVCTHVILLPTGPQQSLLMIIK